MILLSSMVAQGAYYETLPKGVRAAVYHRVQTDNVNSSFSGNNVERDYFYRFNLNAESLESASDIFKNYLEPLREESPAAYKALSLGEYEIDAYAEVDVDAFAFAYGLTNRWTTYLVVPYFNAVVNMNMVRTKGNNNKQVQALLEADPHSNDPTVRALINGVTNSLPDVTGGVIQSVMVNYFGYQPLGVWEGKGLGDVEWNNIIKVYDDGTKGAAFMFGLVAPTGRREDPDILQDFSFGDGQWDAYAEVGGGTFVPNTNLSFDGWFRYTHQFASTQELRVAESGDLALGTEKRKFREKLGDMISASGSSTYAFTDYLSVSGAYIFKHRFETQYDSGDPQVDNMLSENTNEQSHSLGLGVTFSTVNLFKKGVFLAPLVFTLSGQKIVAGQNTPNYSRVDLEFRMYF